MTWLCQWTDDLRVGQLMDNKFYEIHIGKKAKYRKDHGWNYLIRAVVESKLGTEEMVYYR